MSENRLERFGAYVEAQKDYAERDLDGDGVQEFAQKLISAEGGTDGLYWPADEVNGDSSMQSSLLKRSSMASRNAMSRPPLFAQPLSMPSGATKMALPSASSSSP